MNVGTRDETNYAATDTGLAAAPQLKVRVG